LRSVVFAVLQKNKNKLKIISIKLKIKKFKDREKTVSEKKSHTQKQRPNRMNVFTDLSRDNISWNIV
jgi:hypothetical protein